MSVSDETVIWAFRMLLGRDPEDQATIEFHGSYYDSLATLRSSFMRTPEAQKLFSSANGVERPTYTIPPFLLRRPTLPNVAWRFAEPSLFPPVTQLCTSEQMQGPGYHSLCTRLGIGADAPHRKVWEFAYILAGLQAKGLLKAGIRGLGFGTGTEPLPSTLAAAGVRITATDAPADANLGDGWAKSGQWAAGLDDLWKPDLISRDQFLERVEYRPADMNAIPEDLRDYDFCWSACCLEHLGSIRHGLDYIINSLDTLRPGGIAIHTTEFNLKSETDTLEAPGLVLFRKPDIEQVIHELVDAGHHVEPLNLWPGAAPVDEYIDLPPFSLPHLKLQLLGYPTTSIGLIITKG